MFTRHSIHSLPSRYRPRICRSVHPTLLPTTHPGPGRLPLRQTGPNDRARAPALPTTHHLTPKALNCQRPPARLTQPVHTTRSDRKPTPILGRNRRLRESAVPLGAGMSPSNHTRHRARPSSIEPTRPIHSMIKHHPLLVHQHTPISHTPKHNT